MPLKDGTRKDKSSCQSSSPLLPLLLLALSTLTTLKDFFLNFGFCFGLGGNQGRTEIATHGAELKTEVQGAGVRAPGIPVTTPAWPWADCPSQVPGGRGPWLTLKG